MRCLKCKADSADNSKTCNTCGRPMETDPDRYFKAGMETLAAGDVHESIDLLRDCISLDPGHTSARFNLAMALSLVNRCDEAKDHYMTIAGQNPGHPGIFTALGQAAFGSYLAHIEEAEAKRREMVQFFMRAIEQDPQDVDAYFSLGNAYIAIGNAEAALPWLKAALHLHPDSSAIFFTMAKAFKMLHKYPEATVMARKSMQLSNEDDPFWGDIQEMLSELRQNVLPL